MRNDLLKIKGWTYVLNLHEWKSIGTHWVALYMNSDKGFGVEQIFKETEKIISNKNLTMNIYRIQANDSVMCGYFCIGFVISW